MTLLELYVLWVLWGGPLAPPTCPVVVVLTPSITRNQSQDGWGGRRSRGNQRGTAAAGSGLSDAIPGSGGKFFATEVDFGDR